jgi:hypothetical protein
LCNVVFLATTKYVCKLFKLTEMVMKLDGGHIGHRLRKLFSINFQIDFVIIFCLLLLAAHKSI